MASIEGMDTEAVHRIGTQLDGQANAITSIIGAVSQIVDHAGQVWHGSDASDFVSWWTSQHRPQLQAAHDAVRALGQSASNNATEQDRASNAGAHSGGAAAGVGASSLAVGSAALAAASAGVAAAGFTNADFVGGGPEFLASEPKDGSVDAWGFDGPNPNNPGTGDCTSFVAWRLNQLAHTTGLDWTFKNSAVPGHPAITQMGDAWQWGHQSGLTPDSTPAVGAVAWYDKSGAPGMGDGHVAIVRAIQPDHGVVIEESAYAEDGHPTWGYAYKQETVYPGQPGYPTGFLHLLPGS